MKLVSQNSNRNRPTFQTASHVQWQKNNLLNMDINQIHNVANVGSFNKNRQGLFFVSMVGSHSIRDEYYFVIQLDLQLVHLTKKKGDSSV